MEWLLLSLQIFLSGMLLLASTGKILKSHDFMAALRLSYLPNVAIKPIGILVPAFELGLAGALMVTASVLLQMAMVATAMLLLIFTGWMAWVIARQPQGNGLTCGCFGAEGGQIGYTSIVRNIILLTMALLGAYSASQVHTPLPSLSIEMAVITISVGLSLMLAVALQSAWSGLGLKLEELKAKDDGMQNEWRV